MQTGDIQRAKNIVINALEQQYESEQLLLERYLYK